MQTGAHDMKGLIREHLEMVMRLRRDIEIDDIDLIAVNASKNKRVDQAVRQQFASLHEEMKGIIQQIARQIEEENYKTCAEAIRGFQLSQSQEAKAETLIKADTDVHISCRSLKVAVEMFRYLNNQMVHELNKRRQGDDPVAERQLVFQNALLVYELTDFVIRFIEDFCAQGVKEIVGIHNEMQRMIASLQKEQKSLRKQAEAPEIDEILREQVRCNIASRDESIQVCQKAWGEYMQTIRSIDDGSGPVKKSLPNLRLIRDNARTQLKLLEIVAVLQIVQNNIGAIEATAATLQGIKLIELNPDRVKRLIGIK